jgi:hypothetical protein
MVDKSKDAIFVNIHVEHGGAARVTHGPPSPGPYEHAHHAHHRAPAVEHTWKVAYKGKLYAVHVVARAMTISLDGQTVWKGERGAHRTYRAQWSALEPAVEATVLELARSGDRYPHDEPAPDRAAAPPPPSGARPAARRGRPPKSRPKAKAPAQEVPQQAAPQRAPAKKTPAKKAPAKKTPAKAESASAPKSAPKKTAAKKTAKRTAATGGTVEVVAHSRSAPGSKPPERSPAKKTASKKTATKKTASAPAAQPTTRAKAPRAVRPVNDEKVMAELLAGLQRDAPQTAEATYNVLRKAWFNGAREAVLAWSQANRVKQSLAKAYAAWAVANHEQVNAMIAKAA